VRGLSVPTSYGAGIIPLFKYPGPVNVGIVTTKLQKEHPSWKLPERRVNKFVKRYQSKHKNPAGADDDETAAVYKSRGSTRNLFRLFSPNKGKNVTVPEEPAVIPVEPQQEAAPIIAMTPPSTVKEVEDVASEPEVAAPEKVEPAEPDDEGDLTEVPSKDIAYETDDNVASGKEAFHCDVCNIM
jgi:hypothetical protein